MAQVRDGRERQTFMYDVHGQEQGCVIVRMDSMPTARFTAFARYVVPRYQERALWKLPSEFRWWVSC
jgi:hypothetical protein